ncbi:uncharacterized protein RT0683-like [Glandiceps talaboti]
MYRYNIRNPRRPRCSPSMCMPRSPKSMFFTILVVMVTTMAILEYKYRIHDYLRIQAGHCYLTDKEMDDLRFELKSITNVLEEMNVTYWLDYGTLLGAVRNGDVMRHDTDGEISTLSGKPYVSELKRRLREVGIRITKNDGPYNQALVDTSQVWVDIVRWDVYDGLCDHLPCKMVAKSEVFKEKLNAVVKNYERVPLSWILPLRKSDFAGFKAYIPNRPEDVLKNRYPLTYGWTVPYKANCWLPW